MRNFKLEKFRSFKGREGPLIFLIMDGIGLREEIDANAFYSAKTPFLDKLIKECPKKHLYTTLKAHGTSVGLPTDEEMGNSEVGHNAFGAGTVVKQRAFLAKEAIANKALFQNEIWKNLTSTINKNKSKLHFFGLLSDGYVHSHISHLFGLLNGAVASKVREVRVHILLDGRDVPPQSSLEYIRRLEKKLDEINEIEDYNYRIASGGGRMRVTMDRYESDWEVVRRGWDAHVCGIPDQYENYKGYFSSAETAIKQARQNDSAISDQYLPAFVIIDANENPVGKMEDGDGVINFNFRGDRAIQISQAFDQDNFKKFEKKCNPKVYYYGLLQYDEEAKIPEKYFLRSPTIETTIVDYLSAEKVPMFAVSETFKFGHVQYFFEGNRDFRTSSRKINKNGQEIIYYNSQYNEQYCEIKSFKSELIKDNPKMKAYEILEELKDAIDSDKYKFLRVNFTNGDMVGHTGDLNAAVIAAETVDECVREVVKEVSKRKGITIVTADHGNLEDMKGLYETAHTCNPVMFAIVDSQYNNEYVIDNIVQEPKLGNIAATILNLLGYKKPEEFLDSLIKFN